MVMKNFAIKLELVNGILINIICRVRCRKYHRRGTKKGTVTSFVDNLPGLPDNIRYAGKGNYWIALAAVKNNKNKFISIFR